MSRLSPGPDLDRSDLRVAALALAAWTGALVGQARPPVLLAVSLGAIAVALVGWVRRTGRSVSTVLVWTLTVVAVAASAWLRVESVARQPVRELARDRASVTAVVQIRSELHSSTGRFGPVVTARARLLRLQGRGLRMRTQAPILLIGDRDWNDGAGSQMRLWSRVALTGRLAPAGDDDLAAVLHTRGPPRVVSGPPRVFAAADGLRAAIRGAVADRPLAQRALVPAMVDGDESAMTEQLEEDFQVAGLSHLLAVSGTNLTLMLGALLVLARWVGVRGQGLLVVGVLGIAGFVLLARAEPSVVRAAAMGAVALLGLGRQGPGRGLRALGVAVFLLLLVEPGLASTMGFALSAAATAGILVLAPGWRDRLACWLPRWLAEAVAVPLAAQVACTPLVVAVSDQVSLVAVLANLLVAPAVGPTTVLGLIGGLGQLIHVGLGQGIGVLAGGCAGWIALVAERAAGLPAPAVGWAGSATGLVAITLLSAGLALCLGRLLGRRTTSLALAGVVIVAVWAPWPTPGWPPRGWVMVACDVGQGDGLVLRVGPGRAVVVDAGPDPRLIDRCLRRLGIDQVPLLVLTHFHADHVDGLAGVLRGRDVGSIEVTTLADPMRGVRLVEAEAARFGVPVRQVAVGESRQLGALSWEVVGPVRPSSSADGSPANEASVAMLVRARGLTLLLLGDQEEGAQRATDSVLPDTPVDVLKVAHHGSAKQSAPLTRALRPRLAVISAGTDNDYGHPAPSTLRLLHDAGATVLRTDRLGDIAIIERAGLRFASRASAPAASRRRPREKS